jgi:adenosine 3'-phospho 5'-phosphosulfate transporter B2
VVTFLNYFSFGSYKFWPADLKELPLISDSSSTSGRESLLQKNDTELDHNHEKPSSETELSNNKSRKETLLTFFLCFFGLQCSFLLWGLMQERIIKFSYKIEGQNEDNNSSRVRKFTNSQFLVLTNRLAGLILSSFLLLYFNRPSNRLRFGGFRSSYSQIFSYKNWPPLFICSYSSLSNVLSSWFQYESLKYVTFTSQLLAKSSKSVFVMLASKLISNKQYKKHEYFCVCLIGFGIFLFSDLSNSDMEKTNKILITTLPGFLCLLGYLISDSFTSTWQDNLIRSYSISSISLMFITNFYSCLYTLISLVKEGELSESLEFLNEHNDITQHVILLSLTSAIGQIFIFVTIQRFGALVFSLIMTTRQVLSILLSNLVFKHSMSAQACLGIFLIFFALFLQQYIKIRLKNGGPGGGDLKRENVSKI